MSDPHPEAAPVGPLGAAEEKPAETGPEPEAGAYYGGRGAVPLLLAVLALFIWWGWKQGAYFGPVFYPGAIALYLMVALLLWLGPSPGRIRGPAALALAVAFGLGAWTLLSILWTPAPAAALADAQRVFAYATVFLAGLLAVRLLRRERVLALAPVAVAGGLAGIATVATIATGTDLASYLHGDATLRFPIGYRNANAAFFLICLWPAVGLAAYNQLRWELRALLVATGTMLLELGVLAQSRGSLPAAAIALLVYLALSRNRLGVAIVVGLAAIPAIPALPALLDVYRHGNADAGVIPLLHDAGRAVGATTLLSLALAAFSFRVVYPRISLGESRVRLLSWIAAVVVGVAVVVGGSVFVAGRGGPVDFIDQRVSEFGKVGYPDLRSQGVRFGANVGSNRKDFWRVGLDEGLDNPFLGGGAGSFQLAYLKHRRSGESPRDPHSTEVRLISELGFPGLLLLICFVVASLVAALRARRIGPATATLVAAGVAGATQSLLQGSYDWFWQYPAVTAPGFYLLGAAVAPSLRRSRRGETSSARPLAAVLLVALALLAVPLFFADRYYQRALGEVADNPVQASEDFKRAADLNPFDSQPLLARGAVESRLGERSLALEAFRQAAQREPDDYAVHWFIAREVLRTDRARARAELDRARRLNPHGPEIALLQRRLATRSGHR